MGESGSESAPDRWALDETFSILGRGFRVRTTSSFAADLIMRLFGDCRDTRPISAPTYGLDLSPDPARPSSWLTKDGEILFRNADEQSIVARLSWQIMNDAVSSAADLFVIHAGAVVAPGGGAIVLPGGSGSGKTTMVAGLVRAGCAYLSDEMAAFDPSSGLVVAVPRALSIKPGTFEALGAPPPTWISERASTLLGGVWPVRTQDLRPDSLGTPSPLKMVVVPTYRSDETTELVPISRAAGLAEMVHNAFNIEPFGGGRGVELLGRLMPATSCYRLSVGYLDEAVEALLGASAALD